MKKKLRSLDQQTRIGTEPLQLVEVLKIDETFIQLKQKFFNRTLSESEKHQFAAILESDKKLLEAITIELYARKMAFRANYRNMSAEEIEQSGFKVIEPVITSEVAPAIPENVPAPASLMSKRGSKSQSDLAVSQNVAETAPLMSEKGFNSQSALAVSEKVIEAEPLIPINSFEPNLILKHPAEVSKNIRTSHKHKLFKFAVAAMLSSAILFVGWKQWMPKDSIPKKEEIATPSTIQEVPIAPIDSHSKSAQLPTIESKAPLPQNQKKIATKNEFVTIDSSHLKVETIENQSVIKEPMVQILSVEKERQPITKVDNQEVTNANPIRDVYFNGKMAIIWEELYNPSAGNSQKEAPDWYAQFNHLIDSKLDPKYNIVKIQNILAKAQQEFKGITPEQLSEDISPNKIFVFVILNLSVKPATEQQKKDLKTWFHYRKHYSASQDNKLKRCEKIYEEMMEEK